MRALPRSHGSRPATRSHSQTGSPGSRVPRAATQPRDGEEAGCCVPLALSHLQSADPDISPGKHSGNPGPLCRGIKCLVQPPELRGEEPGAQGGGGLVQGSGGFLSAGQISSQLWSLEIPQINQPQEEEKYNR